MATVLQVPADKLSEASPSQKRDQGVLTQTQGLDDQGEVEECEEDDVQFVEAREDAAKAF